MKAVLLAAGLGTRLRPLTENVPKCLVDIGGRPLLQYWFDALEQAGICEVLINTHHLAEQVHSFLDTQRERGFRIRERFEPALLGSAGTIAANNNWADGARAIVVIYADNLSDVNLAATVDRHLRQQRDLTMLLFRCEDPHSCGIATQDPAGRVIGFEEKPVAPLSNLANGGLYVMSPECWRQIASMDVFDIGFDVLPRMLGRMFGEVHEGLHLDVGNHVALERARRLAPAVFGTATKSEPR